MDVAEHTKMDITDHIMMDSRSHLDRYITYHIRIMTMSMTRRNLNISEIHMLLQLSSFHTKQGKDKLNTY